MIYLTKDDILERISSQNLEVIICGDDDILLTYETDAVNEVGSHLFEDYDLEDVFSTDKSLDATIKRILIDILLYNLHNSRVNPRQIPENIITKRDDAVGWLKDVANPRTKTTAHFLKKREFSDRRNNAFSWNSKPKRNNSY